MRPTSVWGKGRFSHEVSRPTACNAACGAHFGESFERQALELGDGRPLSVVSGGSVAVQKGGEGRELIVKGADVVQVDGVLVPHIREHVDAVGCDLPV
jgi:hypothetical protein